MGIEYLVKYLVIDQTIILNAIQNRKTLDFKLGSVLGFQSNNCL